VKEIFLALFAAASYYQVPYELLVAIAKVESALNPHALNVNKDGSKDVGLMQVNTRWAKRLGVSEEALRDLRYNALVGAWVLRLCIERFGLGWRAVDCYNKGPKRARPWSSYTRRVCSALYGGERCGKF